MAVLHDATDHLDEVDPTGDLDRNRDVRHGGRGRIELFSASPFQIALKADLFTVVQLQVTWCPRGLDEAEQGQPRVIHASKRSGAGEEVWQCLVR